MFGFSVSNAGDVDNDGNEDVIVGAPFNDDAAANAGEAYVLVGGDQYIYVDSNITTTGYMTNFSDAKSASDSGANATLKEEAVAGSDADEILRPNGAGDENTWSSGDYQSVNDQSDSSYLQANNDATWDEALFATADSSVGSGQINFVRVYIRHKYGGGGPTNTPEARTSMKTGGTEYDGTALSCTNSWQDSYTEYSQNPQTSSAWIWSDIDAIQIGADGRQAEGSGKVPWVAEVWLVVNYTAQNYKMDIEFNTTSVPSGSNYYLELNYSVDGTETDFGVLVYDGSTWDDMTAQGDLDQTSFTEKSYTLDSDQRLGSGYVRVRYIGRNETSDSANSTLNIEYHRIRITGVYLTFSGESANDNFGWSVGNASDINEDGTYDDIIVGAPGYSSSTGRAYIFHGASSMDSTADVTLTGENGGDKFGFSVHGVGDIDQDGKLDVAVGAPYYHNGATADAGIIYVYSGGSSMDSTYDYFFKGTQANQHFGWSVGLALKFDGGSYNAIIAGSPDYDDGSDTDVGEVKAMIIIPEYSTVVVPLLFVVVLFAFRRRRKNGKQA
jgi:hypothetical protein